MKNELQKHKTSDKIKWILTCICFVLIFALIAGICMQLFADDKYKPSEWFKSAVQPDTNDSPTEKSDGEEIATIHNHALFTSVTETYENAGISTYANHFCSSCGGICGAASYVSGDCQTNAFNYYPCLDQEDCGGGFSEEIPNSKDPNRHIYWSKTREITAPTCTTEGTALYTCACGATETRSVNALGHSCSWKLTTAPTCAVAGTESYTCNRCSAVTNTRTVPATGNHNYSWVITTVPVGDEAGVESYQCSVCSNVSETRTVYALPADPEKEGYHFVGWYTDEDFINAYDSNYIYADTNLYAKFEINRYTVTFDSDGGTELDGMTVDWNTTITPTASEKEGYNFLGWYLSDGTKYENQSIKEDTVLTAHWKVIMFKITFYVDGEVYDTKEVAYGSVLSKVVSEANKLNLNVISMSLENGEPLDEAVTGDVKVTATEMSFEEKVKNNKWKIIGGAAGCIVLVAVVAYVGSLISRKKNKA